jgi:hypothetical protein
VLENKVLRISEPKRHELILGWRKFHNEELHNVSLEVFTENKWAKRILQKQDVVVWSGFISLRIESSSRLL